MMTKQEFLEYARHEVEVIKHLATKVPDGQYDYRPSPPQRSMPELMKYLTLCAWLPVKGLVNLNWDHVEPLNQEAEEVTPETFAPRFAQFLQELEPRHNGGSLTVAR